MSEKILIPTQEFRDAIEKYPYMYEYMENPSRFKVVKWHRGSRKTTLILNEAITKCLQLKGLYWIVSPYFNQGKKTMWQDPNTSIFRWIPEDYLKKLHVNNSECSITFPNGSVLQLVGADNLNALRGPKPYGVWVDEYPEIAKRSGTELREAILEPSIRSSGGFIRYFGTPKGYTDMEYLLDRSKTHKEWWGSVKTVENTGLFTKDVIEQIEKDAINKDFFRQEYYVEVISGASSVFKGWKDCVKGKLRAPEFGHEYICGVDLARTQDRTVIIVIDKHDNHVVYFESLEQTPWTQQKERITRVIRQYNSAQTIVDATGVGDSFVDQLYMSGLPVQAFKISSNQVKRELIERTVMYLTNAYISMPNIELLEAELDSFEYQITANGNITYGAPNGMHDDAVLALALALTKINSYPSPWRSQTEYEIAIDKGFGVDERTGYLL